MSRKRAATSEKGVHKNPRLELAKALNQFVSAVGNLTKTYEGIKAVTKETLTDFDLQIEAKKQEIDRMVEQDEHNRKRRKTEADLEIAEYRYEAAKGILQGRSEVAISSHELQQLKDKLFCMEKTHENDMQKAVSDAKAKAKATLESAVKHSELKHQAAVAVIKATNEQQTREIEALKSANKGLRNEVAEQRKLTAQIAEASRAPPINQSFGK